MTRSKKKVELRGRRREQETLDRLLQDVREGQSRTLVLRGEAGSGKSALLDHLAGSSAFAQVLRASGVESESEIAYSALQQLCAPLLGDLGKLPEPQRAALETAFGLSAGPAPERLLVGLAVLGLFSEAAAGRPLVCLVDDVQWTDVMSAVILGFVARRLGAESVALVFAARAPGPGSVGPGDDTTLAGLPELRVEGLADEDARALLESVLSGPVDARVRDRIVAETRGNPLALLELPRGLSPAELAFGFGRHQAETVSGPVPSLADRVDSLAGRVEEGFQRRIAALPAETRKMLLTAAVEPVGDAPLLWRALERLDIGPEAAGPAQLEGLLELGARVRFPHPLMRSAAWRGSDPADVREVHAALAAVTDPASDPDRRAWHRAHAALGPDEQVAAELAGSADRALARGGRSAAASFLVRAAELTPDPERRAARLVAAASARAQAGAYALVPDLLAAAEIWPLDALQQAQVERLRAEVAFMLHHGRASGPPLLAAARRLADLDPVAARDTFLMAIGAALYAGRFGGDDLRVAAEAARQAPPVGTDFPDLLLAGLATFALDGRTAAVPLLRQALDALDTTRDRDLVWLAAAAAHELYRLDLAYRMSEEAVRVALGTGALAQLPTALAIWANCLIDEGRFSDAADLMDEIDAVTTATGATVYQISRLMLGAYRGPERPALAVIEAKLRDAADRGDGRLHTLTNLSLAILQNGLGNYPAAVDAAQEAGAHDELALGQWGLRELVEAAAHAGDQELAGQARDRLAQRAAATPTSTALGVLALADALAGPPEQAEERFRDAVERLSVTETATQGYRARLLFGEWLRRANRRAEARVELRAAYEAFSSSGAALFAERAGRELVATGETVRKRQAGGREQLTPQEAAIAQLVVAGRTNPEIGTSLFLSPRTVEWHLRKIFTKLGIASRRELAGALRDR